MNCLRKAAGFVAALLLVASMVPATALAVVSVDDWQSQLQPIQLGAQSVAWDGETQTEPAVVDGVYQIGTGAELAWFAAQVNAGMGAAYNAALTADINLGGKSWVPIGNSTSRKYTGTFDGEGYTVSGLSCHVTSWAPAGLFGIVNGGTVQNLVVDGSVSAADFYAVGGIAARIEGTAHIKNCGNLASVQNMSASGRAAGITGWLYGTGSVEKCFNRGSINGNAKTAGIVADTEYGASVLNCYNAGSVTGATAYAIACATTITTGYNVGIASGTTATYLASGSVSGLYCLEGTVAGLESNDNVRVLTAAQMKAPAFVETLDVANWQVDSGGAVNSGYPLLAWERAGASQGVGLAAPTGLSWLPADPPDAEGIDIAYEVMQVAWQPVAGASGYQVRLYCEDDLTMPVFTSDVVEETSYDFFDAFAALAVDDSAKYVFTVTAIGDGVYYLDSSESAPDATGFTFDGAAFMPAPGQTTWNEASKIAMWSRVDGATFYIVQLFRGSTKVAEYDLAEEVIGSAGATLSLQFISNMTGTGDYFFTVRAGKVVQNGPNAGKRAASALAVSSTTRYEAIEGETVEIGSADDWMRIVNLTCEGTLYQTDADAQSVEWQKNYVLTADLDFSNLTAEQQAQTKSWGNINAQFNGTLDGQGHTITGLTLSNGDNGLFAYIGERGVVKNLAVESANVLFNDNAGIFCVNNHGTISCCGVRNTNISSDFSGVIAGFVARNFGLVQDCYVEGGSLVTTNTASNAHAGFVGNNSGTVRRCWTSMDVVSGSYCEGGFCGWADEQAGTGAGEYRAGEFEDCFALGSVSVAQGWCGGFVGRVNSSRATFKNCYAAGVVTSSGNSQRAHGFFGSMGGEGPRELFGENASMFYITLPAENCLNCYYCSDRAAQDNPAALATGMTLDQMRTAEFAETLGLDWEHADGVNEGLPYLRDMAIPQPQTTFPITVNVAVAHYDTGNYAFTQAGDTVEVTFESTGNSRVIDVMRAAAEQGLIEYGYSVSPSYGSFIESINGVALASPDGWMFTVNDDLSDVGVQLASVHDGDQVLWYEGMPANNYMPPVWADVTGAAPVAVWVDIATPEDLVALAAEGADMAGNYRLTANIDMAGVDFSGVGSYERPFAGTFKGKGYTISNLTINRPDAHNVGLFNFIRGAEITGVTLANANVTGLYSVGALVGVADTALDTANRANCVSNLIGRCTVSGRVVSANADVSATSAGAYAGGLVGFNDGQVDSKTGISVASSIDRCTADVAVTARAGYTGGLVGGNYGTVTYCVANGAVSGGDSTGGLFGGNMGTVYDSAATGAVAGKSRTGGFGGDNYNDAIERCYCTGNVNAEGERIGGFLGDAGGAVRHCSSAGSVNASANSSYVGGFVGHYTGSLAGLYVRITFEDNCGWCATAVEGSPLSAIGNMKSSTTEAEQAVLDASQGLNWPAMRERFDVLHGADLPTEPPAVEQPANPDSGQDKKPTVADVEALINAIGVVAFEADGSLPAGTKAAIDAARSAYDALDADQKALVPNLGALETAEELYAELVAEKNAQAQGGGTGNSTHTSPSAASDVNAITPAATVAANAKTDKGLAKVNAKKTKTTVKAVKKKVQVSFVKTKGAVNYRVAYRKANAKKWSYVWTAGKNTFSLKGLATGGLYQYKVAAFAKKNGTWVRSAWSDVTYCWVQGSSMTLKAGTESARVSVKKVKGATGYELRWSSKSTLANAQAKKLAGAKNVKATLKSLRSGKKTYVQVTPYRKYKGHVYYGASVLKAVKAG